MMDADCGEGAAFDTHPWVSSADVTSTPTMSGKFTLVEVPLIEITMAALTLENSGVRIRDVMLADNASSMSSVNAAACTICGLRQAVIITAARAILTSRGIAVLPMIVITISNGSSVLKKQSRRHTQGRRSACDHHTLPEHNYPLVAKRAVMCSIAAS